MGGFVYILESERNGSFYIGSTIHIDVRLFEHNDGRVIATRFRRPWRLVLKKYYPTIQQARRVEYRIKRLKNRKIIEQMIEDQDIRIK